MKGYKNKSVAGIVGILFLAAIGFASTTFAWQSAATYPSTSGTGNIDIFADNGDVVTTDKWNSSMMILRSVFEALGDWPRYRNYSLAFAPNPANGGRLLVVEMNLPSSSAITQNSLGYAGAIHFKDPAFAYSDTAGYKGGIQYYEAKQSLDFAGFVGGVRIVKEPGYGNLPPYLLGWEKISTSDTAAFDQECQYRAKSNDNHMLYPFTVSAGGDVLQFYGDDSADANVLGNPSAMIISAATKSILSHKSNSTAYGTFILSIEKLCLPSYNPNGY